jgi:hypothetical protein
VILETNKGRLWSRSTSGTGTQRDRWRPSEQASLWRTGCHWAHPAKRRVFSAELHRRGCSSPAIFTAELHRISALSGDRQQSTANDPGEPGRDVDEALRGRVIVTLAPRYSKAIWRCRPPPTLQPPPVRSSRGGQGGHAGASEKWHDWIAAVIGLPRLLVPIHLPGSPCFGLWEFAERRSVRNAALARRAILMTSVPSGTSQQTVLSAWLPCGACAFRVGSAGSSSARSIVALGDGPAAFAPSTTDEAPCGLNLAWYFNPSTPCSMKWSSQRRQASRAP